MTDSDTFTLEGSYNLKGSLVNKIDYFYRDSDYMLREQHAEEEGHEEEGHDDHHDEGPTVFSNEASELLKPRCVIFKSVLINIFPPLLFTLKHKSFSSKKRKKFSSKIFSSSKLFKFKSKEHPETQSTS